MRPLTVLMLFLATAAVAVNPDAPLVSSRHEPTPTIEVQPARELWRITDGDTDELMGVTADVTMDAHGNTLILDGNFNTVRLYSPEGEFITAVGREGDGPGEFRSPEQCLALPDGRIGVAELFPARIVTLTREGVPGRPIELPGGGSMQILSEVACHAGRVQACWSSLTMGDDGVSHVSRLQSLDLDGNLVTEFKNDNAAAETRGGAVSVTSSGNDFSHHWAAGDDGRIYVASHEHRYEVEVFAPDGRLERVIRVEYEPVKRTEAEIKAIEDEREGIRANGIQVDLGEIDPHLRDVQHLYPRPDGTLWVRSSRGLRDRPEGAVGAFDVFDREGKFVRRIALAADFEPGYDEWLIVGDRLFILKENLNVPETSGVSGGGGAMVVRLGGAPQPRDDDDREPQPFAVICYEI